MSSAALTQRVAGDGRVARRDRNRLAVLDAMLELFTEDNLNPGPEDVAHRCGLSPRSVYRYFEDREALLHAAIERHLEVLAPLYLIHSIGEGALDGRIETFVTARLRLYEAVAATARATRLAASSNEIMREQEALTRSALREQVERQFAPELHALAASSRRSKFAAIDALCQFETLDHYRRHRRFSSTQTAALISDTLRDLLEPETPRQPERQRRPERP